MSVGQMKKNDIVPHAAASVRRLYTQQPDRTAVRIITQSGKKIKICVSELPNVNLGVAMDKLCIKLTDIKPPHGDSADA